MDAVELGEGSTGVGDAVAVLQHGSAAESGQLLRSTEFLVVSELGCLLEQEHRECAP